MFKYLILVQPLGLMYGSAGAFLSPENLVGRSGSKFPPDAATFSGLFFGANKINQEIIHGELKHKLFVAGPFWAEIDDPQKIYVPMPWTKIIGETSWDEWSLKKSENQYLWQRVRQQDENESIEPYYTWLPITDWNKRARTIYSNTKKNKSAKKQPWKYTPILHPKMNVGDRSVVSEDGLFIENAVQLPEKICLVYLSTYPLKSGCYKFGGENHLVEIKSEEIEPDGIFHELLGEKIEQAFALITPAVWGSNRFSYRYPQHPDFPKVAQMLTDKPVPYRYSAGGRLGRGRYAVPSGSVYVLEQPLNLTWSEWCPEWFPQEGYSLKHFGSGLCLPLKMKDLLKEE